LRNSFARRKRKLERQVSSCPLSQISTLAERFEYILSALFFLTA
jgi:hypothetical protein